MYDNVTDWYKSADTKAHVILGIDGVFIAFLTSSVFSKQNEIQTIIRTVHPITWLLLGIMICCVFGSTVASICCLWSRVYSKSEVKSFIDDAVKKAQKNGYDPSFYPPSVMWFFQHIDGLDDKKFLNTIRSADDMFECDALAINVLKLARNVRVKHSAVNVGFTLIGLALFLLFCAATSHIIFLIK